MIRACRTNFCGVHVPLEGVSLSSRKNNTALVSASAKWYLFRKFREMLGLMSRPLLTSIKPLQWYEYRSGKRKKVDKTQILSC
jgi:hypothetical protein